MKLFDNMRSECLGVPAATCDAKPITAVGTLAFDTIETPFGRYERLLGGSGNYFALAASYFSPVHLISIVGRDFPTSHLEKLRNRGVNITGVECRNDMDSFFWEGKYSANLNDRETLCTAVNVLDVFCPKLVSPASNCNYLFLGNFDPKIQLSVVDQCTATEPLIIMDTMNFWIERTRADLDRLLKKIGILLINDSEIRQLATEHDLARAAYKVLGMGPQMVIIKQGEYGSLVFGQDGMIFSSRALPLLDVKDPTGAGDAFAGGFVGYLASTGAMLRNDQAIKNAVICGTVLSSFVVEDFGLKALWDLRLGDILRRVEFFRSVIAC